MIEGCAMGINEVQTEYRESERAEMLVRMREARDLFYALAVHVGHHQFVEFAGMIGEYIAICEATHRAGRDFATGAPLEMRGHHAHYLAEKMDCIYGDAFARSPDLRGLFVASFLGKREGRALEAFGRVLASAVHGGT
jgi:hypothetical protein